MLYIFATALERQDLSRTHLAHHELEGDLIIIIILLLLFLFQDEKTSSIRHMS